MDWQERDGEQRRRDQPDALVDQSRARPRQQADGRRPQQRDADAGKTNSKGERIKHPDPEDLARAKASHERGVAIVVTSRFAIFKHAWSDRADNPLIQVPPDGFKRVKTTRFYSAYVRC